MTKKQTSTDFQDEMEGQAPPDQDDAAHLDTFRAAELEDVAPQDDVLSVDENGEPVAAVIDPEAITKDAFYVVFEKAFWFPGAFMPPLAPLAIQPGHEATLARDASDAIYEILEIYWPGALLPQSDMLARVMVIVPFAMLKYATVREVLRSAQIAKAEARANAHANTNAPPDRQAPAFKSRRDAPPTNEAQAPAHDPDAVVQLKGGILDNFQEAS